MKDFSFLCTKSRIEQNCSLYGCFEFGPFVLGQGITIANSLRRELLSELTGLAITEVEIDGISHEYSAIQGVRESVLEILLNLKELVFTTNYKERYPKKGFLKFHGPGTVRAGDLKLPIGIRCVDPNQYIATLSFNGALNLKFLICHGKGYAKQTPVNSQWTQIVPILSPASKNFEEGFDGHSNPERVRPSRGKKSQSFTTSVNESLVSGKTSKTSKLETSLSVQESEIDEVSNFERVKNPQDLDFNLDPQSPFPIISDESNPSKKGQKNKKQKAPSMAGGSHRTPKSSTKASETNKKLTKDKKAQQVESDLFSSQNKKGEENNENIGEKLSEKKKRTDEKGVRTIEEASNLQENPKQLQNLNEISFPLDGLTLSGLEWPSNPSQTFSSLSKLTIDPVFSPVKRVNFLLQEYTYKDQLVEKVILEVWTNGSIHPRQAITEAGKSLLKLFTPFAKKSSFTLISKTNKKLTKNKR